MTVRGTSLLSWLQGGFLAGVRGCMGTLKELEVEAGRAARGRLVPVVQVAQEWVFSKKHNFFSTEGVRSPQHQISPCQQNLTLPLLQSISTLSLDWMWRKNCICYPFP